jgi:aryl-alcohol dehydrogenase-like predicted oxidoreductase
VVRGGKARYVGCSNYAAWQLAEAHAISERNGLTRWISAQNRWNLLEGLSDPHLLPACRALGVGLIPYTPLAAGVLTGKYRAGQAPPPGTRVADVPYTRRNLTDENLATVERLRPWTEERGHSPADLAIAWLLAHPEVPSVILGARRVEQLEANVRAAEWRLTADDREAVLALATNAA